MTTCATCGDEVEVFGNSIRHREWPRTRDHAATIDRKKEEDSDDLVTPMVVAGIESLIESAPFESPASDDVFTPDDQDFSSGGGDFGGGGASGDF